MDVFFEQIVRVKRTGKDYLTIAAIWLGAIALIFALFYLMGFSAGLLSVPAVVGVAFVIWGAVKLTSLTYVEYEYIFTNRDFDVDKIIAKSSRQRVLSFKVPSVQKYGKYNAEARISDSISKVYYTCDKDSKDAMYIIALVPQEGTVMLVFEPNERMAKALEDNLPRIAF